MSGEEKAYIASVRKAQAEYLAAHKGVPDNVYLGTLSSELINSAKWNGQDEYPSFQGFADELEALLRFARDQNVLARYLPKLKAGLRQRDAALDELRVAYYLVQCGFHIAAWEPVGAGTKEGEYLVCGPSTLNTFVEVKSPTWESELERSEIDAGRKDEPKYLFCEGRAFANWERIQKAVEKAYGKLLPTSANLLVVPGAGTFVDICYGAEYHAYEALFKESYAGRFTTPAYENLGGVAVFCRGGGRSQVTYQLRLFSNPYAILPLPSDWEVFKEVARPI